MSRASSLHDGPVSASWLHADLLRGAPKASLRQSAIQLLTQTLGCDGLELAAYTRRGLQAAQGFLKTFGHPNARPAPPTPRATITAPEHGAG